MLRQKFTSLNSFKTEAKIIIQFEQSYIVIANQTANHNFVSSEPI